MVLGAASATLVVEKLVAWKVPIPAPLAAETILVGEAGAVSTKQPELQEWVGGVAPLPLC